MDGSSISDKEGGTGSSEFRLVYCPNCQELLTEFAHIPFYQCARCDTVLQGKNFEENSSPHLSPTSEEYGHTPDLKCLSNQGKTDADYLESVATNFDSGKIVKTPIFYNENQSSASGNDCWTGKATLGDSESLKGSKEVLHLSDDMMKHDEVGGRSVDKARVEKTPLVEASYACQGCASSSGSNTPNYEKEETLTSTDNMANHPSGLPQKGFATSRLSDGRKEVNSLNQRSSDASEKLHSVQGMKLESYSSPENLSTSGDSAALGHDCIQIIRELDELRDHLVRTRVQRGINRRDQMHVSNQAHRPQQLGSFKSSRAQMHVSNQARRPQQLGSFKCSRDQMHVSNQAHHPQQLGSFKSSRDQMHVSNQARRPQQLGSFKGSRDQMHVSNQARRPQQLVSFKSSHGTCEHSLSSLQSSISSFETRNHWAHMHRESHAPSMTLDHLHYTSRNHPQGCGSCNLSSSCSNETYRSYCHSCLRPPRCNKDPGYHDTERHELEVKYQSCKVELGSAKYHCRPFLGGSCFISCYNCLRMLQIPEDFQILMRTHGKLRCGGCFQVLKFSVCERTRIVPYFFDGSHFPAGESGSDGERYDIGPPLHTLMGYISASEILYDNWD